MPRHIESVPPKLPSVTQNVGISPRGKFRAVGWEGSHSPQISQAAQAPRVPEWNQNETYKRGEYEHEERQEIVPARQPPSLYLPYAPNASGLSATSGNSPPRSVENIGQFIEDVTSRFRATKDMLNTFDHKNRGYYNN